MSRHRARESFPTTFEQTAPRGEAVWVERRQPDPYRKPGVPDRIVISLTREGNKYVGQMCSWEYREIEVTRNTGNSRTAEIVTEMVVDVSRPRLWPMNLQLAQGPTLHRLIAAVVVFLEGVIAPF